MDFRNLRKKQIAVIFGGRSVEHEISVITALQLIGALDVERYDIVPVYISLSGKWYTGEELLERSFYKTWNVGVKALTEVSLLPQPGTGGLTVIKRPIKSKWRSIFAKNSKIIPVDLYLPAFHGEFGEDGCIQGLFELADVPYAGCGVTASAVAMDKLLCKSVLTQHKIPSLPATVVRKAETISSLAKVTEKILSTAGLEKFPLFVKPLRLGSSIGIAKAVDEASLHQALASVFKYDTDAIVEPFVKSMFEINISVMKTASGPRASVVEIPVAANEVLSYEDKYLRDGGKKSGNSSQGMASLTRSIDPADLNPKIKKQVTDWALKAFEVLDCNGAVRFDFMHDNSSGKVYFNELNPFPGSLSFYLWIKSQPAQLYTEELNHIIASAEQRYAERCTLDRQLEFRALAR